MRKSVYHVAISLDGFIANPDGGWQGLLMEGDHLQDYIQSLADYSTVLMGRHTYEVGLKQGVSSPYPMMEQFIISKTLSPPRGDGPQVAEDPIALMRHLKEREGKAIWICGGGKLATTLFNAGLIDEVHVKINPSIMGQGLPMAEALNAVLSLESLTQKIYQNGVILSKYKVNYPKSSP